MTCARCKKNFREGDKITAHVLSVYHEIDKPRMDQFRYAIERPFACMTISHLYCGDDDE